MLLRPLYYFFRLTLGITLLIYFRRYAVLGRANTALVKGPTIVVSNHPNTLMDVLTVAVPLPRILFFLANYGLFKHPVSRAILTTLWCIPIKRKEDVPEGELRNNDVYFEQCYRHFERGGALYIAPEGQSWMNRFVRPLKTGTARIGFGAEARNNFQLGLKILPVGLSYSAPNHFRSDAYVKYGTPIYFSDWQAAYEQDPDAACEQLTNHLYHTLQQLSIHTGDEAGEAVQLQMETLLLNSQRGKAAADFERLQYAAQHGLQNADLRQKVQAYFEQLTKLEVSDLGIVGLQKGFLNVVFKVMALLIGAPFFTIGWVLWAIPSVLPWLMSRWLKLYIGYTSTVRVVTGYFFTFPLCIWALFRATEYWRSAWWHFPLVLLVVIILGLFTDWYLRQFRAYWATFKALMAPKALVSALIDQRTVLLSTLEKT
jgi:glycerol-3-phosphate O-acyltransferase / dihydroxyacetone phosphate acyltransferase